MLILLAALPHMQHFSTSNNDNNGKNLVSTFHVLRAVLSILHELFDLLLRTTV